VVRVGKIVKRHAVLPFSIVLLLVIVLFLSVCTVSKLNLHQENDYDY